MATEDNFLQSFNLEEANKLLESSPEPADRVLDDETFQDPPTAEAVPDGQAPPYPEGEAKVEDMEVDSKTEPPEGVEVDLGLSRFGPLYLRALKRLLDNHEPFLRSEKATARPMHWSQSMKVEKLAQFHEASKAALDEMMIGIYKDRNVLFREAPDSGPVADPIDPILGAKVAQKAAAERPANTRCACATVHRAIFTCPVGAQDHPQLCITVANYRNSMMEPAKPPITFRKADASAVKPIPKKQAPPVRPEEPSSEEPPAETFKKPQQKRGRDNSRGRGRGGSRNNSQSRDSSQDSRPDNKRRRPSRNSQNAQRRIDRSRDRSQTPAEPGFNPEFFRQLFTSVLTPPATPVSIPAPQTAPVSDPRVRPSPTPPPSATVTRQIFTPSEHGDKVIRRPDGKIDWRYAPVQPSDLPPDRKFDADVRDGHWCVRISKK
jgi:hypothetical protein